MVGGRAYDLTRFDRYLDTALKYHAPRQLKVIGLVVWFQEMNTAPNAFVTVREPDGKKTLMRLPPAPARAGRALLAQRGQALRMCNLSSLLWHWRRGKTEFGAQGWTASNRGLFDPAAAVERALRGN